MKLRVTLTVQREIDMPLDTVNNDGAKTIRAVEFTVLEDPCHFVNNRSAKISVEVIQI